MCKKLTNSILCLRMYHCYINNTYDMLTIYYYNRGVAIKSDNQGERVSVDASVVDFSSVRALMTHDIGAIVHS
jgi:hypothetical protein